MSILLNKLIGHFKVGCLFPMVIVSILPHDLPLIKKPTELILRFISYCRNKFSRQYLFLNKNSSDFVQTRCFLWYLFNCNDTFIATLRQNQVESKFLTGNSPLKSSQLIEMISFCIYLNYYR